MNIEGKPWPINKELSGKGNCSKKDALVTVEKVNYEMFYWDRLKIVSVAQFSFGGINSPFLNRSIISKMLYDYGVVCFFIDDAINQLLCLPCTVLLRGISGTVTRVRVISPYITNYERILDVRNGDRFYVCFDTETELTPKIFFKPWIEEMAELSVSIRVNAINLRAPIVGVSSVHQKLSMENILQAYVDGKYFIEIKDNETTNRDGTPADADLTNRLKTLDLAPKKSFLADLDTQRNTVWNKLMETLGFKVNTAPFKKERAITGEVEGNAQETISFYSARKNPRLDTVEWLRDIGCKDARLIEVTKAEDIYLKDIDETAETIEEVE